MAIDATPAATRRRLSRFPGPSPRPSPQLVVPSTPAATPPPPKTSRKSRLSTLIYTPPDSAQSSPSISAPPPFEWDAARSHAAPPYGPPGKSGKVDAAASSPGAGIRTPRTRIFRKASIIERFVQGNCIISTCSTPEANLTLRMRSVPAHIAFELSMFPHNLPLPPPKETGQILGALMHLTHLCAKWAGRSQAVPKDDPDDIWKSEVDWSVIDEGQSRQWSWVSAHVHLSKS